MEIQIQPQQPIYQLDLNEDQLTILITMFEEYQEQMEYNWKWRDDNEYGQYLQMFSKLKEYSYLLK